MTNLHSRSLPAKIFSSLLQNQRLVSQIAGVHALVGATWGILAQSLQSCRKHSDMIPRLIYLDVIIDVNKDNLRLFYINININSSW